MFHNILIFNMLQKSTGKRSNVRGGAKACIPFP